MKKLLLILFVLLASSSVSAMAAQDPKLIFNTTDGKYIYCNNYEALRRSDLADNSNENAKYIMSNPDMEADNYSMFVSHTNNTALYDKDNHVIAPGFDIEVDVLFKAEEDTEIEFTQAGFEVPDNSLYWYNGKPYTYENEWGCFNCWATYLDMPIRQIDSGTVYSPSEFKPVTVKLKKGDLYWLSDILPDYSVVSYLRPMNLMADFEIKSGKCEIDVAALKSTGTLGDRSNFNPNAAFGSYERDRQYKGVASSMNEVDSELLTYEIDNSSWHGQNLGVVVYNPQHPDGYDINTWYTHLNPRADKWSGDKCASSDMLAFEYYDPAKSGFYGSGTADKNKDNVWHFDISHSDTSLYNSEYGFSKSAYTPNWELNSPEVSDYACNLGNYGVKVNYNISVTNSGDMTRYFNYRLATSSNNIVYATDENGNIIDSTAFCKGSEASRVTDNMVCVELSAHTVTNFTITVILTTFNSGGMENSFVLTDYRTPVFVYDNVKQEITKDDAYTGREDFCFKNNMLYLNGRAVNLPSEVLAETGANLSEYKVYWTGNGYILRPGLYDGIPSYAGSFFKTVYFFDKDFNYISQHKFPYYPNRAVCANGIYYINAGAVMYSDDNLRTWKYFDTNYYMPCSNYGTFSAALSKNNDICISSDGINFERVVYQDFDGDYIDSVGNSYYYADKKNLYLSDNGIYWDKYTFDEIVSQVVPNGDTVTVNGKTVIQTERDNRLIVKLRDSYLGFSSAPYIIDGITYAPLRFLCEQLGFDVNWADGYTMLSKDGTKIILPPESSSAYMNGTKITVPPIINDNGTSYIPLRMICELAGYDVSIENNIITVE